MNRTGLPAGYVPIPPTQLYGYSSPPLRWRVAGQVDSASVQPTRRYRSVAVPLIVAVLAVGALLYAHGNSTD